MRQLFSLKKIKLLLAIFGPGLVVMLADTDAGSIITAAQTGAIWSYKMINIQLILIPILFITQELTIRLGIVTGKGHGELIKKYFGLHWAWFSVATLMITCIGAIITQFVGLVGVGSLFGIPNILTIFLAVGFLIVIVITGTYRSVERIAMAIGLFELIFVVVAFMAHPSLEMVWTHLTYTNFQNTNYVYLLAANIGAIIMPWMIFYQQSAIVDKQLKKESIPFARWDTAIGALITQVIMIAIIMTTAATIGKDHPGMPLNTVHQINDALTPYLGVTISKLCFAGGLLGASLVAAIVVSLTAAWSLGEITGFKHSLEHKPKEAPWFYISYIVIVILGGLFVLSGINLVNLSVAIEVLNALLLPIVLGFLFLLAIKALPKPYALGKYYRWIVGIVLSFTALFGLITSIMGIQGFFV